MKKTFQTQFEEAIRNVARSTFLMTELLETAALFARAEREGSAAHRYWSRLVIRTRYLLKALPAWASMPQYAARPEPDEIHYMLDSALKDRALRRLKSVTAQWMEYATRESYALTVGQSGLLGLLDDWYCAVVEARVMLSARFE
jgi:hypothetical protein